MCHCCKTCLKPAKHTNSVSMKHEACPLSGGCGQEACRPLTYNKLVAIGQAVANSLACGKPQGVSQTSEQHIDNIKPQTAHAWLGQDPRPFDSSSARLSYPQTTVQLHSRCVTHGSTCRQQGGQHNSKPTKSQCNRCKLPQANAAGKCCVTADPTCSEH